MSLETCLVVGYGLVSGYLLLPLAILETLFVLEGIRLSIPIAELRVRVWEAFFESVRPVLVVMPLWKAVVWLLVFYVRWPSLFLHAYQTRRRR